jgi:hypothetical protein
LGSESLQLAESGVGFVMDTLMTRFVTGHQREGSRLVSERSDGHGDVDIGIGCSEFLVDGGCIANHFAVDENRFGAYETTDTPAGYRHLIDQLQFGGSDGLMDGDMFGQKRLEFISAFALQDYGTARGQAVLEGILGRGGLSLGGFGTVRFGPVDSRRFGLQI